MANIAIGFSDWGDSAAIEASSVETTGFEAEQLQATQPSDYWESQTATPFVEMDRGSAQSFNIVALLYTNAASGDTWRVRAAADQASLTDGTADYDSGSVSFRVPGDDDTFDRHHGLLYLSTAQTRRWVRIDLSIASGIFEAGRLVIGDFMQPAVNDAYGRAITYVDPNRLTRTDGGALYSDDKVPFLRAEIALDFLTEAEAYGSILDFQRRRGKRKDMLVITDPEETTYLRQGMVYGRLTRDSPVVLPQFDRYQHRLTIEEGL